MRKILVISTLVQILISHSFGTEFFEEDQQPCRSMWDSNQENNSSGLAKIEEPKSASLIWQCVCKNELGSQTLDLEKSNGCATFNQYIVCGTNGQPTGSICEYCALDSHIDWPAQYISNGSECDEVGMNRITLDGKNEKGILFNVVYYTENIFSYSLDIFWKEKQGTCWAIEMMSDKLVWSRNLDEISKTETFRVDGVHLIDCYLCTIGQQPKTCQKLRFYVVHSIPKNFRASYQGKSSEFSTNKGPDTMLVVATVVGSLCVLIIFGILAFVFVRAVQMKKRTTLQKELGFEPDNTQTMLSKMFDEP